MSAEHTHQATWKNSIGKSTTQTPQTVLTEYTTKTPPKNDI